jgi:hypothetical protein
MEVPGDHSSSKYGWTKGSSRTMPGYIEHPGG